MSTEKKPRPWGLLRCAVAAPKVAVGDVDSNSAAILQILKLAEQSQVEVLCLPELSLSGYTCGDLFHQTQLLDKCRSELQNLVRQSKTIFGGCFVLGMPLSVDGRLYNCGVVIAGGHVVGVVPKTHLPNYKEFYERRWFVPGPQQRRMIELLGATVPFGRGLIFQSSEQDLCKFSVEVCEDLWMPIPESSLGALGGAILTLNLSASNEVAGKADYRRTLVSSQSGRCLSGYLYAGAGPFESTTDMVFGGHCMIAENGAVVVESAPFADPEPLIFCDVDLEKLHHERMRTGSFYEKGSSEAPGVEIDCEIVLFQGRKSVGGTNVSMEPKPEANPYLPADAGSRAKRCEEIFSCQVVGLQVRLSHLKKMSAGAKCTIGVSGGLDSTLALLVSARAFDGLSLPRSSLMGFTLPGFGTSDRTFKNAKLLMAHLGLIHQEIDIRSLALEEMRSIKHKPFGIELTGLDLDGFIEAIGRISDDARHDLTFENVQARIRTSILMNQGFVIGTGDLSEIALGWSTYNADHMSMYNPNAGVPKTLVKHLVQWASRQAAFAEITAVLQDVLATEVSPELLPLGASGELVQLTENTLGPYELHDFFLFYFVRFGFSPEKILFLAEQAAFSRSYPRPILVKWLKLFVERFFANQYKRSASPDGPKVGSVSLSPRGDWRMPSDAASKAWLEGLS